MTSGKKQLAIPRNITLQFGVLFGFIFFNNSFVAMRSVLLSIIALACLQLCVSIQKALSKI